MLLTRDLQLDWSQVPDPSSGKLLPGFIQFKVVDWEEKMTSSEGVDKDGNAKVSKYMLVAHLEATAPEDVVGMTRNEYFVVGSNDDPMMQRSDTFYRKDNYGASGLKGLFGSAQVPWSSSLLSTLNSSIGAMFILAVTHRAEKRRDTGEAFVGVATGRTFKIGEKAPQIVPCNLPGCEDCKALREAGTGHALGHGTGPVAFTATPTMPATPVFAGANYPGPPTPSAPAAPKAVNVPPMPTMNIPPLPPMPAAIPMTVASAGVAVAPPPMPQPAPPVPPPAATIQAPPVSAPNPGTAMCRICGMADIPIAEYGEHVSECAQKKVDGAVATLGFKQEA